MYFAKLFSLTTQYTSKKANCQLYGIYLSIILALYSKLWLIIRYYYIFILTTKKLTKNIISTKIELYVGKETGKAGIKRKRG
jgi:hypothetical protein